MTCEICGKEHDSKIHRKKNPKFYDDYEAKNDE